MPDLLHPGQWQGFYAFGPEYGNLAQGKEAEFRMFIEEYHNGEFSGRAIDWQGFGADGEVSQLKGFIKDGFISFTKQYSIYYTMNPDGSTSADETTAGHTVEYEGQYDPVDKYFYGSWEISIDKGMAGDFSVEEVATGTWRMICPQ